MTVKDTESKTIDHVKYTVRLLGTSRAFVTSQELAKLSLPSLGAAVDGFVQDGLWDDKQTFSEVAILLTAQMGTVDLLEIIKELLEGATADGKEIDFENHFKGSPELLVDLVELALRGNFGGLFTRTSLSKGLRTFIEGLKTQAQPQETSSPEDQ